MESEKGIYILVMKDQYRLAETDQPQQFHWSHAEQKMKKEFVPTRLVEYYKDACPIRSLDRAYEKAYALAQTERSHSKHVFRIHADKTWRELINEAMELAPLEFHTLEQITCNNPQLLFLKRLKGKQVHSRKQATHRLIHKK